MSGGRFDYRQYQVSQLADDIHQLLHRKDDEVEQIAPQVRETVGYLRRGAAMAQRIDWYVSGDDGIDSFCKRWAQEVPRMWEETGMELLLFNLITDLCGIDAPYVVRLKEDLEAALDRYMQRHKEETDDED